MINNELRLASDGWFSREGQEMDVINSSRIRLARNIEELVFPGKMESKDFNWFYDKIIEKTEDLQGYDLYNLNTLKLHDRQLLAERHYLKPGASFTGEQCMLIRDDEQVVTVFNDTDHIRIKSLQSGLDLRKAYNYCNEMDNIFEDKFNYAVSPEFGYLTTDLTSAGTGMSASAMLFLPAIRRAGKIDKALTEIVRAGFSVRGFTGENTEESLGDLYIIDNQFSIGQTEEEIIIQLESVTSLIAGYERETREIIFKSDRLNMEDEVFRAKGILENCRKISLIEAIRHLSSLKLGKYYNLIDENITYRGINCLLLQIQKSHLIKNKKKISDEDTARAEFIRNNLFMKG
ncbi:MAG: hypothetical protein RBT69_09940 [Spirochaetia bacterium]|jgi:protein arginine kinase|nr:hypothetical protein [Spirochaetia bacterium]